MTGGGTYNSGTSATVIATANSGYNFTNWKQGSTVVSTSASYTFTVTANRALVATFAVVPPTVAQPILSPNGGTFFNKVKVTLSDSTSGAKIYYTTNGTTPTTSSKKYGNPFTLNTRGATITVKTIATKGGYNNSAIASASFTIQ